jgi:hypothetical protein
MIEVMEFHGIIGKGNPDGTVDRRPYPEVGFEGMNIPT